MNKETHKHQPIAHQVYYTSRGDLFKVDCACGARITLTRIDFEAGQIRSLHNAFLVAESMPQHRWEGDNMKILMVGGLYDGVRQDLPAERGNTVTLKECVQIPVLDEKHYSAGVVQTVSKAEEYKCHEWLAEDKHFYVYALSHMSPCEVMSHILGHYPERTCS